MEKRLVVLGIALIFLSFYAKGISFSGTCNSSAVQCDLQITSIEVLNDSSQTQIFTPLSAGEAKDWVTVLPESMELEPGYEGTFGIYTIAPCYVEPGNYSAEILIQNGQTEKFFCDIEIGQGHFVDINLVSHNESVTQCKEASYTIELENNTIVPKQQKELVNLQVIGLPAEWFSLETTELIVEQGEKKRIGLTVQAPCDAPLKDYDFEVKAVLFNENFFSTAEAKFSIKDGQDLIIRPKDPAFEDFSTPFLSCNEKELLYKLEIENNGEQNDAIKLEIVGSPFWAKLSETSIQLDAGEKKEVELSLLKNDEPAKTVNLKLKAISTRFNFEKTWPFSVKLDDCYNLKVEKILGEQNVCSEDELVYKFELLNDKETPLNLKASVSGIKAAISPKEFTVSPGQAKQLEVAIDVSADGGPGSFKKKDLEVEIILDSSGSMDLAIEGEKKIDISKKAILSFVKNISKTSIGLRVFEQNENCGTSKQLIPISALDAPNIESKIKGVVAAGYTPLAESLMSAVQDFKSKKEKFVILVSDGKESCDGDIEQSINTLLNNGIKVFAIGFDIDQTGKEQLKKISQKTFGQYFDASNSQELIRVFNTITSELEVKPSKSFQKTFTLLLESKNFYFEKDFSLNVSDCYNIEIASPDVAVCRQVESQNSFAITNLGSKEQSLSTSLDPLWVTTLDETITLAPGEKKIIPITLKPTANSSQTELIIAVKSDNANLFDSGKISYLSGQSCYGFDLKVESNFTGRIGKGERRKINIFNNGQTDMLVSVQANQPWVFFEPNRVMVKKGEIGFVNFFISPPFGLLGQKKKVVLSAFNEFGLEQEKELTINVIGPGFGLIPAKIAVTTQKAQSQKNNGQKTVTVEFELKNNGGEAIEIYSIESDLFPKAQFLTESAILEKGESTKVTMTTSILPEFESGLARTKISLFTSEGRIERFLEFEIMGEKKEPGQVTGHSGLFNMANASTGIILVLILIVAGLLAYSVFSHQKAPAKKEPKTYVLQKKTIKKPTKLLQKKKVKKSMAKRKSKR